MSTTGAAPSHDVRIRDNATGRLYNLDTLKPVGTGGEATIYAVREDPNIVAKIYKRSARDTSRSFGERRAEKAEKLRVMLANQPVNPTAKLNHQSYAWPQALISGPSDSAIIGFLMPFIGNMKVLFDVYNPSRRRETCPFFDYRYLISTARNIAGVMSEVHSKGYVIGDVNQKNILVSDSAVVTVIDTDSFQVRDPKTGRLFLCLVDTPGFLAPERSAKKEAEERTVAEDLFKLGLLIFHLLMEGVHPFTCQYDGTGDPPRLEEAVSSGHYPYRPGSPLRPMGTAPPIDMLPPELRALLLRCFASGHAQPGMRPSAREWQKALDVAAKSLVVCRNNSHHFFSSHLGGQCPWCERIKLGLRDSFPDEVHATPVPPSPPPWQRAQAPQPAPAAWTPVRIIFWIVLVILALRFLISH